MKKLFIIWIALLLLSLSVNAQITGVFSIVETEEARFDAPTNGRSPWRYSSEDNALYRWNTETEQWQSYSPPEPAPARDAFSRWRVSNPTTLFDAQFTYNLQPLLWEQDSINAAGAIDYDATNACAKFTMDSIGHRFMQTYEWFRYQPSKSQLIFITFNMHGGRDSITKYAGYTDTNDGIEFAIVDSVPTFRIFTTTDNGDTTVVQSDWNLDKLDGTGKSRITIDFTKTQILVLDFQSLYVGRVRIGFDIDGDIIYAHEFNHANIDPYPYFRTANLPLRVGIESRASSITDSIRFICSSVVSEGGQDDVTGYGFAVEGTVTAASGADTHILSIEPDSMFNGLVNRSKLQLESLDIIVTGSNPVLWKLCLGQALTSSSRTDVNTTYSAARSVAGTLSGTPQIVIAQGYAGASNQVKQSINRTIGMRYPITLDGSGGIRDLGRFTVLVQGVGGTSATRCVLNWKEIR